MSSEKKMVPRDAKGRIMPGHTLNPGGKTKGVERMMRELVESQIENWDGQSLDGWEAMTMMMYQVAMGRKPPGTTEAEIRMKDRMAAAQFLFDRVHGKAKITVESETTLRQGMDNLDINALSRDELDALEAHVEILAAKMGGQATSTVIDISPADAEILADPDPDKLP